MARKTETTKIGEHFYRVTQMGARRARGVERRLASVLGAGLEGMLAGGTRAGDLARLAKKRDAGDAAAEALGPALAAAARALTDDDQTFVLDALAECTLVCQAPDAPGGQDLARIYDDHFAGRSWEHWQWVAHALRVNFADFFGGAVAMLGRAPLAPPLAPAS